MNFEPKLLLTIVMEGGALVKGEPEIKRFSLTKKDLFPNQKFKGNEGNKVIKSGTYKSTPLIAKDAVLKTRVCKEAYDSMVSSLCPAWFKNPNEWRKLSATERLEINLARTCEHFGGKSFSYTLIDE
jgi:hypothetical protein